MLGATLSALFLATAALALLVLADAFLRGRAAFMRLRDELSAEIAGDGAFVIIEGGACETPPRQFGRVRPVSRGCGSRRSALAVPLRAAA